LVGNPTAGRKSPRTLKRAPEKELVLGGIGAWAFLSGSLFEPAVAGYPCLETVHDSSAEILTNFLVATILSKNEKKGE